MTDRPPLVERYATWLWEQERDIPWRHALPAEKLPYLREARISLPEPSEAP